MPASSLHIGHADLAACRAALRSGSRTFHLASKVLPGEPRAAATALYAFCRLADDLVDEGGGCPEALEVLHARLDLAYAGQPADHPADRAFAGVVARYAIPRALPEALLEGFAWDAAGRRYEDLDALIGYAARVAGSVGVMMSLLMGVRDGPTLSRACDLGLAMQLTNIARDVGEDARNGRVYLPLSWLEQGGVDVRDWMGQPRHDPALAAVVGRLLAFADVLYRRAQTGICRLPAGCRPGMFAARSLYAEIGREVERQGLDSVTRRAVVSGSRKLRVLGGALVRSGLRTRLETGPTEAPARYLVDAACEAPSPDPRVEFQGRVGWVLDLFERLERADQGRLA